MDSLKHIIDIILHNDFISYFPRVGISDLIEIGILTIIFYYIAKSIRGTRAWILLKGVLMVFIFYALAYLLNFNVIVIIFQSLLLFLGIAVVVVMQPEIRKIIERIGTNKLNVSLKNIVSNISKVLHKENSQVEKRISDKVVQEIIKGCSIMSKAKTGALIVIEGDIPLNEYIDSGIGVNADITSQLLINIFEKNTPLHDGAVIVRNNKVCAATCYLPLTDNGQIDKDLGTRHRAAIGISECTDSLTVIVSEETGAISVALSGEIHHGLNREQLLEFLRQIQNKQVKLELASNGRKVLKRNLPLKIESFIATFILWFLVISTANPIITTTLHNIPIEVINTDSVTSVDKTYEILSGETTSVVLRDRKEVLDNILPKDIKVIADFSKLSIVNAITLEASIQDYPDTEIKLKNDTMTISLEDVVTTEMGVEINQIGDTNEKYYISNISLDNETITISGAKSVISTIGKVEIDIDESKLTSNTVLNLHPNIYDKNGKKLDNLKFKLSTNEIQATIELYKTKIVPVNITPEIANESLQSIIQDIAFDTTTISITGPDEALEQCKSIDIKVPLRISIDSESSKNQYIKKIKVQRYLPENIMVTPNYSDINLTVTFTDFYTKDYYFTSNDIEIKGLSEDKKAKIEEEDFNITLISKSKNIEELDISKLSTSVDVTNIDLSNGSELADIVINGLPEGIFYLDIETVEIYEVTE